MTHDAERLLDTCGLLCPEPVMLLHNAIRDAQVGDVIRVLATDPATTRDIPKFCQFLGHVLESQEQRDDQWIYRVRKQGKRSHE
jgi:tRNA 2-thiouridine synthesizing protein A